MNILFLSIAFPKDDSRNLYSDLLEELASRGHNVTVVCSLERRHNRKTALTQERGYNVLRVQTTNITGQVSIIEKGFSYLSLEYFLWFAIKKHLKGQKFDLLLYSTPPTGYTKLISKIRRMTNCKTYLLLKDIFPQNAVDMGLMRSGSIIWKYFKHVERKLYSLSDNIGCMSPANVRYVLKHNPEVSPQKVHVNPNSVKLLPDLTVDSVKIREEYGISQEVCVFAYGGNLGRAQGLDFLISSLPRLTKIENSFWLVVGAGSEYEAVFKAAEGYWNVEVLPYIQNEKFEQLLKSSNVGLVFLNKCFTIPNYPSRMLSYMQNSLPMLAATDSNTDVKDLLTEAQCGTWVQSGDELGFVRAAETFVSDQNGRKHMGTSARDYFENHFTASHSADIIESRCK